MARHRTRPRTSRDLARRTLSQNFLRDPGAIAQVIRAARPHRDGLVVEVGAGRGALTDPLARACGRLLTYELDRRLAAQLAARYRDHPTVRCVHGDFLAARPPGTPFAVVGNVPYAITSGIVTWCLAAPRLVSATLVTQREYARKRAGDYGRWSRLTVETWPRFDWRLRGHLPRTLFWPVPAVDSAILRLDRRPEPLPPAGALEEYRETVTLGFGGAGGSLDASLRRRYPARRVRTAMRAAGLAPGTVVAHVHPDRWVALFRELTLT